MTKPNQASTEGSGWSPVPTLLFALQAKLGLSNDEIMLILHVSKYQFSLKDTPFPREKTIAAKMEKSDRTIRNWKRSLVRKGFLIVRKKIRSDGGYDSSFWDFNPLWTILQESGEPGVQLKLFPDRKGDGGMVQTGPESGRSIGKAFPEVSEGHFRDPRKGISGHKEEEVEEEEKKEDFCPKAAGADFSGTIVRPISDQKGVSLSEEEDKFRQIETLSFGSDETILPDFGDVEMTDEDKKRIADVITAAKARTQKAHDAKLLKKEAKTKRELTPEDREHATAKRATGMRLKGLEALWREELQLLHPDSLSPKWGQKERGMISTLLKKYENRGDVVAEMFRYLTRNWEALNKKMFKGNAAGPTLGMVVKLHESMALEAQQWAKVRTVIEERDEYYRKNPYVMSLPTELEERVIEAEKVFKTLGLK